MGLFNRLKINSKESKEKDQPAVVALPVVTKRLLLKPIVTEKTTATGTYCFKAAYSINKQEAAKEFKVIYGKTPRKVNILNVLGKTVQRGRTIGKQADWKKVIIYLNKGESIDLFAN
ncbi:MAG: 50S ribosomal protein L23 [Patescibacteria group bacterium]|jgi:ribosomal protein L23